VTIVWTGGNPLKSILRNGAPMDAKTGGGSLVPNAIIPANAQTITTKTAATPIASFDAMRFPAFNSCRTPA
jgi:hypothetical protein